YMRHGTADQTPNNTAFDQLLNVKEIAERADISVASVWRLTKAKIFPQPTRVGKTVRWPESRLKKYLGAE
ncbi:MAG: helix-turn-helix domain-containing protein, partial [Roseibium sp.]